MLHDKKKTSRNLSFSIVGVYHAMECVFDREKKKIFVGLFHAQTNTYLHVWRHEYFVCYISILQSLNDAFLS